MPHTEAQIAGSVLQPLTSASYDSCGDAGDLAGCFECSWRGETKAGRGFVKAVSVISKHLLLYHSRCGSAMLLNITQKINYMKEAILSSLKKEIPTPVLFKLPRTAEKRGEPYSHPAFTSFVFFLTAVLLSFCPSLLWYGSFLAGIVSIK